MNEINSINWFDKDFFLLDRKKLIDILEVTKLDGPRM